MDKLNVSNRGRRITADDIESLQNSIQGAIFVRSLSFTTFGIVADQNPTGATSGQPFFIEIEGGEITVAPGAILFENGEYYDWTTSTELELPDELVDHLIVARVVTVDSGEQLSRYSEVIPTNIVLNGEILIVPEDTYSLETNEEVLARIHPVTGGGWTITLEDADIPLRRWAYPIDRQHRSSIGTGVQTDQNPHALSINDLTVGGDLYLWSILTGDCVVTGNKTLNHFVGTKITQIIPTSKFVTSSGLKTTDLDLSPYTVISVMSSNVERAFTYEPHNKQIAFQESVSSQITVTYTTVHVGQLSLKTGSNTVVQVSSAGGTELAISGGKAVTITDHQHDLTDLIRFALSITVIVNDDGGTRLTPNMVFAPSKIADVQASSQGIAVSNTTFEPSTLLVGMAETSSFIPGSVDVDIELKGLDENDEETTETINIGSSWAAPPSNQVGFYANQYVRTIGIFKSLTNVKVTSASGVSIDAIMIVLSEEENPVGLRLGTALTKANSGIQIIRDERHVVPIRVLQPLSIDQAAIVYDEMSDPKLGSVDCEWDSNNSLLVRGTYLSRLLRVSPVGENPKLIVMVPNGFGYGDLSVSVFVGNTEYAATTVVPTNQLITNRNTARTYEVPVEVFDAMNAGQYFRVKIQTANVPVQGWYLIKSEE